MRSATETKRPRAGQLRPARIRRMLERVALLLFLSARADEPTVAELEFFERDIRPLLIERCYSCHSGASGKTKGGLALDSRAAWRQGGNSGPAIVPGNPNESLLILAVRYEDDDLQMPPNDKRLTEAQIARLEAWILAGAPTPRESFSGKSESVPAGKVRAAAHWAFQPVRQPLPPPVDDDGWVRNDIDRFVLAKLEATGMHPAPEADPRTLIRRVSYDLVGLPPSPEAVAAFVESPTEEAYAGLVDRLLASPRYGERWGRYWLDVARYADTRGYLVGGQERRFPFSYTYRDYVVRSFNEDKPYDRFLVEQIAADHLPLGEDKSALAALGFLTLGRSFLNNQNDIIDDRMDVVIRGTQALTIGCARCHQHKFDPITMEDYYGLHGVFASSEEPEKKPLLRPLTETPEYLDYLERIGEIEIEIEAFKAKEIAKFRHELRQRVGAFLLGAHEAANLPERAEFDRFAGERKLNPDVLRRWMAFLAAGREAHDPVFAPWFECAKLSGEKFAAQAGWRIAQLAADESVSARPNRQVLRALAKAAPQTLPDVAKVYDELFTETAEKWDSALKAAAAAGDPEPTRLPDDEAEALRLILYGNDTPLNLPRAEAERILARRLREGSAKMRNRIAALDWTHPGAPARAMALVDKPRPRDSRVFLRGNPRNPGPKTPRRFLAVLDDRLTPFEEGSGRLELARAIANPENPLTARVYVNRVWRHHFGRALVPNVGDFGIRTEAPLHLDLLDSLAARFMEEGWSTKALHRRILLSATYRQSSRSRREYVQQDPENRYLHHANRRRLDFEAMRDTLLTVSGTLDPRVGGQPEDLFSQPFTARRTVYGFIDRQNLPGVFRTFDFANPDVCTPKRFRTTVPQQALFMMNSPFVIEQAQKLVRREAIRAADCEESKIETLHRLVHQRSPDPEEMALAQAFLAGQPEAEADPKRLAPWERYAQVLLLSNELVFVD